MVGYKVHMRVLVIIDVRIRHMFVIVLVEGNIMWSLMIVNLERVVVNRVVVLWSLVNRCR